MVLLCYESAPGSHGYSQHLILDSLLGQDLLDRKQDAQLLHNLLALFFRSSALASSEAHHESELIVEHVLSVLGFNRNSLVKLRIGVRINGCVEVQSLETENGESVFS